MRSAEPAQHFGGGRERHPDAGFPALLNDGVRQDTIQAECHNEGSYEREAADQPRWLLAQVRLRC